MSSLSIDDSNFNVVTPPSAESGNLLLNSIFKLYLTNLVNSFSFYTAYNHIMPVLNNFSVLIGLLFLLFALIMILVPPQFGNYLYGVSTKLTLRNETVWFAGQKLFAFSYIGIGIILILLGALKIEDKIHVFPKAILVIALWIIAKYFVHRILLNRYSKD